MQPKNLSIYVCACTRFAPSSNNHGESAGGNIVPLQTLVEDGEKKVFNSSDAIRFAMRYGIQQQGLKTYRKYNPYTEDKKNEIQFDPKAKSKKDGVDIDLFGYLAADKKKEDDDKEPSKGCRGVVEVQPAVSLSPFENECVFNSTAGIKTKTSIHITEVLSTRYQYFVGIRPNGLADPSRTIALLNTIRDLNHVAGNHARFQYDFCPESVILRVTDDIAPRFSRCFKHVTEEKIELRPDFLAVLGSDIPLEELYIGGLVTEVLPTDLKKKVACCERGIKNTFEAVYKKLKEFSIKE